MQSTSSLSPRMPPVYQIKVHLSIAGGKAINLVTIDDSQQGGEHEEDAELHLVSAAARWFPSVLDVTDVQQPPRRFICSFAPPVFVQTTIMCSGENWKKHTQQPRSPCARLGFTFAPSHVQSWDGTGQRPRWRPRGCRPHWWVTQRPATLLLVSSAHRGTPGLSWKVLYKGPVLSDLK